MTELATNHTTDAARVTLHDGGSFVASYGGESWNPRSRPRIAHDPTALAVVAEALNIGLVVELHPDDVMPALAAGAKLASLNHHADTAIERVIGGDL